MPIELKDLTIPIWIYDIDQYCIYWANQPALALWESDSLEELCSRDFESDNSAAVEASVRQYQRAFEDGNVSFFEHWHFVPKGIPKSVLCLFSGYVIEGDRTGILIQGLPSDELNHSMQLNLTAMLSDYSMEGNFISGNPPFLDALGHNITHLNDLIVDPSALKKIYRSLSQSGRFEDDVLMSGAQDDRWYHLIVVKVQAGGEKEKLLMQQYNIHQRKTNEIFLAKEVLTDALTGLLNRRGLDKKLEELDANKNSFSLYYIDLDGFKAINDSFGHSVGDQVLQTVADRLLDCLPVRSAVCRFGGDEFVVIVPVGDLLEDKEALANRLVTSLSQTYYNDTNPMVLSASIGLAQYLDDGEEKIANVVFYADAAMYQAKKLGKRRWVNYETGMEQVVLRHSAIAQQLSYAKDRGELKLYYQPVWESSENGDERIISFEVLIRWHSPSIGEVLTEEVTKVAEEIGVLDNIERWAIEQGLTDLLVLRECFTSDVTLAINLSSVHLRDETLVEFLSTTLDSKKICHKALIIECSEKALVDDVNGDESVVSLLVDKGINVTIDDFGRGYSSLAYLHHIPAVMAKIDRSFIAQITQSSKALVYIQGLIEAHGMRVLALGVETENQKEILASYGINLYQGNLLGRPQPLDYYVNANALLR